MTTRRAEKYQLDDKTPTAVLNDVTAFLTAKGLSLGPNSNLTLVFVLERPLSNWVEITV
jgi:hypothetical protein